MMRKPTRRAAIVASLLTTIMLIAGCGVAMDDSTIATTGADLNQQPRDNLRDGGSLTTALTEVTPQWNTFQADGSAYTLLLWRWYNPTLAYFSPDGKYSFNRDYLTDVSRQVIDGNTVVTYTINPKAQYNDGAPIDYRSFEATWRTSSGTDSRYIVGATDGYDRIDSVRRGADDRQAVVRFRGIYAWPDGLFNVLVNPKASDPETFNKGYVQQPHPEWGAGPYRLASYDRNAGTVVFERNPRWWGNPGKLDRRVFRQMESQAAINAFRNGELDATGVASKDLRAQVLTMNDIDIRTSASPQKGLLLVNIDAPLLRDVRVREALLRGIDRETLARIRFTGLGFREELPGSLVMYPFQPGYRDNLAGVVDYDPDRARALLDAAGWRTGDDGIRVRDGKRLELEFPNISDDVTTHNLSRALQAILRKVGIDLRIRQRASSDFSKVFINKEFDVFLMGFSSSDPFGMAYLCQTWCANSQLNRSGAGYPELDVEIRRVGMIADEQAQIAAGNDAERRAFRQYSNLPLFNGPAMVAVKEGLANYGAGQFYIGPVEDVGWQK